MSPALLPPVARCQGQSAGAGLAARTAARIAVGGVRLRQPGQETLAVVRKEGSTSLSPQTLEVRGSCLPGTRRGEPVQTALPFIVAMP